MKLNAIKMLSSLCNDKEGMESFIVANGAELLNKILESLLTFFFYWFVI